MSNGNFFDILNSFFTVQAIAGYVGGVVSALSIVWLSDIKKHTDNIHKMRLMAVLYSLMILFVGWVSVQIEHTAICMGEVQATLAIRSRLSDVADKASDDRDTAATDWIKTKDYPPVEIARLRWEDPIRQHWIHDQDAIYTGKIKAAQDERKKALTDRFNYIVPESRCGKR